MQRTLILVLILVAPMMMAPTCHVVGDLDVDDDGDGFTDYQFDCDDGDPDFYPGIIYNSTTGEYYSDVATAMAELWDNEVLHFCGDFDETVHIDGRAYVTLYGYGATRVSTNFNGSGFLIEASTGVTIDGISAIDNRADAIGGFADVECDGQSQSCVY